MHEYSSPLYLVMHILPSHAHYQAIMHTYVTLVNNIDIHQMLVDNCVVYDVHGGKVMAKGNVAREFIVNGWKTTSYESSEAEINNRRIRRKLRELVD